MKILVRFLRKLVRVVLYSVFFLMFLMSIHLLQKDTLLGIIFLAVPVAYVCCRMLFAMNKSIYAVSFLLIGVGVIGSAYQGLGLELAWGLLVILWIVRWLAKLMMAAMALTWEDLDAPDKSLVSDDSASLVSAGSHHPGGSGNTGSYR